MKISSQEEYGLRCLVRIARTERDKPLTLHEIASAEGLSVPYVAKLLAVLRQHRIVESALGRSGGYRLAADPGRIGLSDVMAALGERLFDEAEFCGKHAGTETHGECVHRSGCSLRVLWRVLEDWMSGLLKTISLADLLHNEHDLAGMVGKRITEMAACTAAVGRSLPMVGPKTYV